MTALTAKRATDGRSLGAIHSVPVAASTTIYGGSIVMVNTSGYAVPASTTNPLLVIGVATETVDNSSGAAAALWVNAQEGVYKFAASTASQASVGQVAYAEDDQTVDETAGAGEIVCGRIVEYVGASSVWVDISPKYGGGGGAAGGPLASGYIWVGNSSGEQAAVAMSGDATISNTGVVTVADVTVGSDAAGDTLVRGASAYGRLGIGTAGQMYLTNSGATSPEWASMSGHGTLAAGGALTLADSAGVGGLFPCPKMALCLYDFSVDGGAQGAITLSSNATIPDNAIVELMNYHVVTTCTSAADTATIKIGLATDGDLSTAIAINDGANPWDAGGHLASGLTPLVKKTTAARAFVMTVATQDLTAGKICFAFRYWIGE